MNSAQPGWRTAAFAIHSPVHQTRPDVMAAALAFDSRTGAVDTWPAPGADHGLLNDGQTVDAAIFCFMSIERSRQLELAAKVAGTVVHIDPEQATLTYGQCGTEFVGWLSFQPLWGKITREQPELLD